MSKLDDNVRQFLEYCEVERGRSARTIDNYQHYLARFLEWAKEHGIKTPQDIDLEKVKKYRLYLNRIGTENKKEPHHVKPPDFTKTSADRSRSLKKKTQNYHIIALRAFLKYLAKQDIKSLSPEKIELAKEEDRQISFLEEEELEKLLSAPNNPKNKIFELRDKAVLELLFSTGLRVSELVNLNRDNINPKKKEFSILGKGGKLRVVFLSDRAQKSLNEYLSLRKDQEKPVFINHITYNIKHAVCPPARLVARRADEVDNIKPTTKENKNTKYNDTSYKLQVTKRLTPRSIQRLVKKYAIQAGITKKVTPHTLRHSFGTDLLRGGADLRAVQQLLGHSSITTTQIYTHVTDQHLREVHQAFHGKMRKD